MGSGSLLVSRMPNTGIPSFFASATAMASFFVSTTKRPPGRRFISLMPPRLFSSFSFFLSICRISFFVRLSYVPSTAIFSKFFRCLILFLIVVKLVSIPPSHLSETNGTPHRSASTRMISLACFLVPSINTCSPVETILLMASQATIRPFSVLFRSMM